MDASCRKAAKRERMRPWCWNAVGAATVGVAVPEAPAEPGSAFPRGLSPDPLMPGVEKETEEAENANHETTNDKETLGKRALCIEWSRWRPPRLAADRGEAGPLQSPPVPAFGVSVSHPPPHRTRQTRRTRKTALCYVTQTRLSIPGKLSQ